MNSSRRARGPAGATQGAIALGAAFGSGGRTGDTGGTGCAPVPAAHGSGLIALPPADRKEVAAVAHAGATWPVSSYPSAQIALEDPEVAPAEHVPADAHVWPAA